MEVPAIAKYDHLVGDSAVIKPASLAGIVDHRNNLSRNSWRQIQNILHFKI